MDYGSEEESDVSESEIDEYVEKPYEELRSGMHKVRVNGQLRCPFCAGKKKQDYKYKDLLQHASGVAKGSANRSGKQKVNHLALARYLESYLADEVDQTQLPPPPKPVKLTEDGSDRVVFPYMGVVVVSTVELSDSDSFKDCGFWLKRFKDYKPVEACTFWTGEGQTLQVILRFGGDWDGLYNALAFEKSFEAGRRSRKEWNVKENNPDSSIYGWCARADDYDSGGAMGEYIRREGKLSTISDISQEFDESQKTAVANIAGRIDEANENLGELECQFNERALSLSRMLEEKDRLHRSFYDETKRMQQMARENVRRILDEQEKLSNELEKKKRHIDNWSKELNKRETLTEREKQKLDEEKQKNDMANNSLHLASMEKNKADENVIRLVEEQKREKEEALNKIVQLEKQLDAKQKLEMEIQELKGRIQVMKHLEDQDDEAVQQKMEKMAEDLQQKVDDLTAQEELNNVLVTKDRESNDELQKAREILIAAMKEVREATLVGIKRMGEINPNAFENACKRRFPANEVELQQATLCSSWQEHLKDSQWYPFKVIATTDGSPKRILDEGDDKLQTLRREWGDDAYDEVVRALKDLIEYNASGRYVTPELWSFKDQRKATLKEVIAYIIKDIKSLNRSKKIIR